MCGGKAGIMTRAKLVDGSFICGDCVGKCSSFITYSDYEKMTLAQVETSMRSTQASDELYRTQFQASETVAGVQVDRNHGWWAIKNQPVHDVFAFNQITSWQLILDTEKKSDDEKKEKGSPVYPPRNDLPVCPWDEKIKKMYVCVTINDPALSHIDINVMNAIFVSDYDIEKGYKDALALYNLFESITYQQPSYQQPSYQSAGYQQQGYYQSAPVVEPVYGGDSADALKKYKELLDMGAITRKEYEAKKKQILGF